MVGKRSHNCLGGPSINYQSKTDQVLNVFKPTDRGVHEILIFVYKY